MCLPAVGKGEDIVYAPSDRGIRDERTGLNEPLVYRLCHQAKCRVAMFGRDKRWKHLSAKPLPRLILGSWKITRLIGSRCKIRKDFSQGVLISRTKPVTYICISEIKNKGFCLPVFYFSVTHLFPFRTEKWKRWDPMIVLSGESRICWHTKALR